MKIRTSCSNSECVNEFVLEASSVASIIKAPVCPLCGSQMVITDMEREVFSASPLKPPRFGEAQKRGRRFNRKLVDINPRRK